MRVFTEQAAVLKTLSDVHCNVCGQGIEKDAAGYLLDHVSLSKEWGYLSPYDGEAHAIDLCVGCYQSWIGQFKIPPQVA